MPKYYMNTSKTAGKNEIHRFDYDDDHQGTLPDQGNRKHIGCAPTISHAVTKAKLFRDPLGTYNPDACGHCANKETN